MRKATQEQIKINAPTATAITTGLIFLEGAASGGPAGTCPAYACGWGGGAVKAMTEMAQKAGFEVYEQSVQVKYVPDAEDLKKCFEFGQQIAAKIKA